MKISSTYKTSLTLLLVLTTVFALSRVATASQLENISWAKGANGADVLALQLDDHPGFATIDQFRHSVVGDSHLRSKHLSQ